MEKVIEPTFREKSVEKREEAQCNNADLLSANPAKCVLGQSGNVIVQSTRNNTNGVFKTEKGDGFTVDEEEGESLEERDTQGRKNISTLTSRHYAGHVRVFKEWLKCKGMAEDFEEWEPKEISNWLSEFYKESHLKHGGTKKASSLRIIRSAIDHHLKSAPYCKSYSLTHSLEFSKANATLHDLEAAQKDFLDSSDCNTSALPLTVDEVRKLWATGVVGIKTPKSLQRLVFLAIGINFGVTSRDDLRDLKPGMFEFHIDEKTGLEYASCNLGDSVTSQLKKNKNKCSGRKMFSVPGSLQCPVAALKLFLKRRNPACSAFFQIPNRDFVSSGMWYRAQAAGLNCLSGMLKDMSHEALLPVDYSNHNLRATPPIVLYKAMEDIPSLQPPRIVTNADLSSKIALNNPGPALLSSVNTPSVNPQILHVDKSPGPSLLGSVHTSSLNGPAVDIDKSPGPTLWSSLPTSTSSTQTVHIHKNHSSTPDVESSTVKVPSYEAGTGSNASNPSENIPNSSIPQNFHHVLCMPQQWNIKDIIRAVTSGDALVITRQSNKRELQSHENGEITQFRDNQQLESNDVLQNLGRDRSGRKQPEPKRLRRDPDVIKEESSKVDDDYKKAINVVKTGLQSLDDLLSKQHPSNLVIQELSQIGDNIQELLQRINTNGVLTE